MMAAAVRAVPWTPPRRKNPSVAICVATHAHNYRRISPVSCSRLQPRDKGPVPLQTSLIPVVAKTVGIDRVSGVSRFGKP